MSFNATLNSDDAFVITPSTNGNTKFTAVAIYVGGTGGQFKDVNLMTGQGTTVLHKGVPVGNYIRGLMISAVRTTSTTASATLIGYKL